ncbi:TPA: restriction endonuclease subunit S [Vibrio parahaemolyticus]|nr:restriction endonuclease subunit S [Vibrio parahaemolyticus]HCG6657118.1 restriction endonuclease subunit S [Vibrio parahaemolyticus]
MTGRYKSYPSYKESGAKWLGNIPSNWVVKKLKYLCQIQTGTKDTVNAVDNGKYPFFVRSQTIEKINSVGANCEAVLTAGDGVGVGKVYHYFNGKFDFHQRVYMLNNFNTVSGRFVYYYLSSNFYKVAMEGNAKSTVDSLRLPQFLNFEFSLPAMVEQNKIVNFLDHETAKIDTLIAKQEKLIELLKEKRQAVISHAVTKGLNPDAPIKDSGVEWLGEVPEHWDVLPTKRFFRLVAEPSTKNHNKELLSVYAAIGVAPRKELEQKGNKASNTDGYWLVQKGDIIVNKLLAWMGAVGYSDYDGVTSPAYDILRKTKDINPKFYHYLFRQEFTQKEFKRWSRGIMEMRLRLYFEELGRIMMPMPPKEEQNAIVDEIEAMNSMFSKIEDKARFQIELLTERKTALISAAVTGKIDVRDWDAQGVEG